MVWTQYADESHMLAGTNPVEDVEVGIDDYYDPEPEAMDYEYWVDWYSRDLMNMWMSLRTYLRDASVNSYLMTDATFSDFCEFVYRTSHGFPSLSPS